MNRHRRTNGPMPSSISVDDVRSGRYRVTEHGRIQQGSSKPPRTPSFRPPRYVLPLWGSYEQGGLWVFIPVRLVSEANQHEHPIETNKRKRRQQEIAVPVLNSVGAAKPPLPLKVVFTRLYPVSDGSKPFDSDNLQGSAKYIRDSVAKWLGVSDGSSVVTWSVEQEASTVHGVRVDVLPRRIDRP